MKYTRSKGLTRLYLKIAGNLTSKGYYRYVFQIVIYVLYVVPNMWAVLKHYEALGTIKIRFITLPGDRPTQPLLLKR